MSQNIEHIEAKLCAYIDELLDENEAALIEKYLAAHPAERQVIEDLKRMRQFVQQLPMAKAPPEICQGLQSYLERSLLLDESRGAQVAGRIVRWPQWLAAAAILLLGIGLAIVVWVVLSPPAQTVVLAPTAAPAEERSREKQEKDVKTAQVEPDALKKELRARKGQAPAADRAEPVVAAKPSPTPPPPHKGDAYAEQMGGPAQWPTLNEGAPAPAPAGNAKTLWIPAGDIAQVRQQVVALLESSGISYSELQDAEGWNERTGKKDVMAFGRTTTSPAQERGVLEADAGKAAEEPARSAVASTAPSPDPATPASIAPTTRPLVDGPVVILARGLDQRQYLAISRALGPSRDGLLRQDEAKERSVADSAGRPAAAPWALPREQHEMSRPTTTMPSDSRLVDSAPQLGGEVATRAARESQRTAGGSGGAGALTDEVKDKLTAFASTLPTTKPDLTEAPATSPAGQATTQVAQGQAVARVDLYIVLQAPPRTVLTSPPAATAPAPASTQP